LLQKTLELVHFLEDILALGPASGYSTETGERGLKQWAKQPSITAQKRSDAVFSKQVCERIHERALIDRLAESKPLENEVLTADAKQNNEVKAKCANFVISVNNTATVTRVTRSGKPHKIQIEFPQLILSWFHKNFPYSECAKSIQLFTELVLPGNGGHSGTTVRAHPNYQSNGAWYDYALAKYEEEERHDEVTYPVKLVGFFRDPSSLQLKALVQEVDFQSQEQTDRESQLFRHWTLNSKVNTVTNSCDAIFVAIPVESLSDRIYVIDPAPVGGFTRRMKCDFDILAVKYVTEEWPQSFLASPSYLE
jgi:hypothetical protein